LTHLLAGYRRYLVNFLLMVPIGADAGDGYQFRQITDQIVMVLFQPFQDRFHERTPYAGQRMRRVYPG
jgi:hypothetical protein